MKIFKYFVGLLLLTCLSVIVYSKFLESKWNGPYGNPKTSSRVSNRQITSDKALDIVASLPEVKKWQLLIAKSKASTSHVAFEDFNNLDINEKFWNIHVFEEFPDHRATFNWYEVDKQTGVVTPRFENDKKDINDYYRVYQNPNVIYLRKSLNAYLANDSDGSGISQAAVKKNKMDGITSGLDSFSKDYYKSKFVVLTIDENPLGGGTNLQIIFQDKPDRIFYAWVYKLADPDNSYELRGFNSKDDRSPDEMKDIVEAFKDQILDKEHSI